MRPAVRSRSEVGIARPAFDSAARCSARLSHKSMNLQRGIFLSDLIRFRYNTMSMKRPAANGNGG